MRLTKRVAIVTGAGAGIGAAIAHRLAEEGAHVVLAERQEDAGERVAAAIIAGGGSALALPIDVSDAAQVASCVQRALSTFGRVDILVNNAGISYTRPTLETTLEDWRRVLATNLDGTFLFCRAVLPGMVDRRSGVIINISSVHSRATVPGAAPYAASKGGISALTRALAAEFGPLGIRVNAVCPGSTDTTIWQETLAGVGGAEIERYWRQHVALDRIQAPREVANVVAWLASDEASYVTGADIFSDGGMTALLNQRPPQA